MANLKLEAAHEAVRPEFPKLSFLEQITKCFSVVLGPKNVSSKLFKTVPVKKQKKFYFNIFHNFGTGLVVQSGKGCQISFCYRQHGNLSFTQSPNPANLGVRGFSCDSDHQSRFAWGLKPPGKSPAVQNQWQAPAITDRLQIMKNNFAGASAFPGGPLTLLNVGRRINLSDFWRCPGYRVTGNTSNAKPLLFFVFPFNVSFFFGLSYFLRELKRDVSVRWKVYQNSFCFFCVSFFKKIIKKYGVIAYFHSL